MNQFSEIYETYYPKLLRFAETFVGVREDSENILHDVFMELWNRMEEFDSIKNVNAYLYRMTRNGCLDFLKHRVLVNNYKEEHCRMMDSLRLEAVAGTTERDVMFNELNGVVNRAIESLPKKCRQIYLLNRHDGLKYVEIADKLGISENTVGTQMKIAIQKLRQQVSPYLK